MERSITGFQLDEAGDYVAHLDCGHRQHVRHCPPFQLREWVLEEGGRRERLGSPIECPLCDRCELPADARLEHRSPEWDEHSLPAGLRRAHCLGRGTWAVLTVHDGALRLTIAGTDPPVSELGPGASHPVPPGAEHEVTLLEPARVSLEFYSAPPPPDDPAASGGEAACWAHLVCEECGAVEGGEHRPGCRASEG
ncbi:MAG TPA: DUF3565 domain-containing protein [Acidimicrobiales bacterium]|nr:DUF3565 domain-containing protein [Acidimicrobiales bacterium]